MLNTAKARNILLLSLIVNDSNGRRYDDNWKIYYHLYLDQDHLDSLRAQAKKLHGLSFSLETWHKSKYGRYIRFCDFGTLTKVGDVWKFYSVERTGNDLSSFETAYKSTIQRSNERKAGFGSILTGLRSAAPACLDAFQDVDDLHKHFWKYGSTDLDCEVVPQGVH